jgi:hypothetical protein
MNAQKNQVPLQKGRGRQGRWAVLCLAAAIFLGGAARSGQQQTPDASPGAPAAVPQSEGTTAQVKAIDDKSPQPGGEPAGTPHNRQIADDSAKLLKLATDLKAEVDKTNRNTLSLRVIRTADEIEHLAHNVHEKMKLTVAEN